MTRLEAAALLDPVNMLNELDRYEDYGGLHGAEAQAEAIRDACRLAAEALRLADLRLDQVLWQGREAYADSN